MSKWYEIKEKKVVTLEISSWYGISVGAQHSYGYLHYHDSEGEYHKAQLKRKLNENTAQILNTQRNKGRHPDYHYEHRAGEETVCFDDDQHIIRTAKRVWKKICPDADILLVGMFACGDPQRCLIGPSDVKKKINDWHRETVKIGGYEEDEDRMDEIFHEYQEFLKEYFSRKEENE